MQLPQNAKEVIGMRANVPYEKCSKKERRNRDRLKRGTWGELNPVTRRPERSNAYSRSAEKEKSRRWERNSGDGICFVS